MTFQLVLSGKTKKTVKPRSRLGCNGCKKLKIKCDEIKPICSRCKKRGIPCNYSFEMMFQNTSLAENKKTLRIKDLELLENDEKRIQRLALLKSTIITDKKTESLNEDSFKISKFNSKNFPFDSDFTNMSHITTNNERSDNNGFDTLPYNIASFVPISDIPILPLPENLLDHPYYKDAFEFYKHFTSHFIVAARPQIYKDNPMNKVVPAYATKNNCLLDLLVAYSLTHRSMVLTDENFSSDLVELLISRGLFRLVSSLSNNTNSIKKEVACITAILMCTQKIFVGQDTDKYKEMINLARNNFEGYVENYGKVKKLSNGKYLLSEEHTPFPYFLLTWIGYFEIIGVMMAILPKTLRMPDRPNLVFENFELKRKSKIDLFMGFDINFLIIFDKLIPILSMLEEIDYEHKNSIPIDILSKAIEWEHELNLAYQNFKSSKKNPDDLSESDNILIATNEAFYNAGLLHLYRRVYKVSRLSSVIQELVKKIYEIFKNDIDSASSAENCSVFPLFIAACESIQQNHKSFFYDRFQIQFLGGNLPAGDVLKILTNTWNTGDSWVESAKRVRKESGFFLI